MITTSVIPRGISEKNRRQLTILYRSVTGPFSVEEAADVLSLTIPRTHRFLAYLADRGWLARIYRGLYAPIPLDTLEPSEWREDPWIVAPKRFGPDYYIGGWTACEHWDLTEQTFLKTMVITTRRLRSKEIEIQGFPFRVKRTAQGKIFGTSPVWRNRTRVNLSDPSRTVADVLDDPSLGGGIRHIAGMVYTYFSSEHRNDTLLDDCIERVGNRTGFKRLGYLLETQEIHAPGLLQVCKKGASSGVSLLDPSLPAQGPVLRRWNLRVNGTIQSETVDS